MTKVQVLGLCRFSVPSDGAFQTKHATIEERRAMLYRPDRLDRRLTWFRRVLLPGIQRQTDPDFQLIVLIGQDMPDPWLSRLQDLIGTAPQMVAAFAPAADHRAICADAIRGHVDDRADRVAQFRLDDDDAVAVDFVARVRADAGRGVAVFDRADAFAVDYCKGLVLEVGGHGVRVTPRFARLWTPGLAVVLRPGDDRYILDFPHHRLWQRMPVLSRNFPIMWVRGAHDGNDSNIAADGPGFRLDQADAQGVLSARFGIDLDSFALAIGGI